VRARAPLLIAGLALALLLVVLASAVLGQAQIPPSEVIGSLLRSVGIPNGWAPDDRLTEATLWVVRFPRILMGIGVGAALAVAGAVMQAIFGNPLAEPGIVGVSSGAALGAALAIALGVAAIGGWVVAALAFAGGLGATLLVYLISRSNGRAEVVTLILTGIAINAAAGAGIAFALFATDSASREQIVFWQLGSLNGTLWPNALLVAGVAVAGTVVARTQARRYDLLALGERNARHLGVHVDALRLGSILLVALVTGAAVAFCGIISFVGLVVPHLIRLIAGPGHRTLITASAVGGALLVVGADLIARTAIAGADLPIGVLTSLLGAPVFLGLLARQRRSSGGWA